MNVDACPTQRPVRPHLPAWTVAPAALALVLLVQTSWFQSNTSETFDEPTFMRLGFDVFRKGDFHGFASPMDPVLPVLLQHGLAALDARVVPDTPGWEEESPRLIRIARRQTSVVVGVPLVLLVYVWLGRRRGWVVGTLGGALVALSPTIVAAASLATTDACYALFGVIALASIRPYQDRPCRRTFLVMALGVSLAFAAKQSAVFLIPLVFMEVVWSFLKRDRTTAPGKTTVDRVLAGCGWVALRMTALGLIVFFVDWALFGFCCWPSFGPGNSKFRLPVIVPMITDLLPDGGALTRAVYRLRSPLPLEIFFGLLDEPGHRAYLMGDYAFRGWWYFFPVAIALKSTPAELLLIGVTLASAARPRNWFDPARRLWFAAIGSTMVFGMLSPMNYGHRHVILVYPASILAGCDVLAERLRGRRPGPVLACALLAGWQAVSIAGVSPHYLGYFNSFCGGPSEGYRYLVDSSLDWGQDLPSLRRELEARGYRKVALRYFGTALPRTYGVRSTDWHPTRDPVEEGCDWLAISATERQGAYSRSPRLIELFDPLPSVRVAYTFFLYDLSDPRVREAERLARQQEKWLPPQN